MTAPRRARPPLVPALLALLLAACGDGGTDPQKGGDFTATLVSPARSEGAAVIELSGPGVESVTADGGQLFSERAGDALRVVVVLDPPGEVRFRMRLAPGNPLPTATVVEVADGESRLRPSLAGYRVRFAR